MDNLSDFSAKETDGICFMQDILGGTGYSDTEAFDKKELKKNVDTERNLTWHSMDITKPWQPAEDRQQVRTRQQRSPQTEKKAKRQSRQQTARPIRLAYYS